VPLPQQIGTVAGVDVPPLVVSAAAVAVSAGSVYYARRSDRSARASADAAGRQAAAAERALAIETERWHGQLTPRLSGVVSCENGAYQLTVRLGRDQEPLTALEVQIRPGQGISFQRGFAGVDKMSADQPALSAHDYGYRDERPGLQPGTAMSWWAQADAEHALAIVIDCACHRGGETWPVVITAEVADYDGPPSGTHR
jgi:hypothetical protein